MVFSSDGKLVTTSDIYGTIDKVALDPNKSEYSLIYDNFVIGKLNQADFNQPVIKLREKIVDVEPVVIKDNAKAKYILLKGNFNTYVFVNNKLNSYGDGIITFVFDNKTKELRSKKVQQYRVFELLNPNDVRKNTSEWDYKFFLNLPDMNSLVNINDFKNKENTVVKEVSASGKDIVEVRKKLLQDKEFSLLGYRFFDSDTAIDFSFGKGSKKSYRDLLEFSDLRKVKLKHKSEPNFNQIIVQKNFYPTEMEFSDQVQVDDVKFRPGSSKYKTQFWQEDSFPNMQKVFESFFKNDLREVKNK